MTYPACTCCMINGESIGFVKINSGKNIRYSNFYDKLLSLFHGDTRLPCIDNGLFRYHSKCILYNYIDISFDG